MQIMQIDAFTLPSLWEYISHSNVSSPIVLMRLSSPVQVCRLSACYHPWRALAGALTHLPQFCLSLLLPSWCLGCGLALDHRPAPLRCWSLEAYQYPLSEAIRSWSSPPTAHSLGQSKKSCCALIYGPSQYLAPPYFLLSDMVGNSLSPSGRMSESDLALGRENFSAGFLRSLLSSSRHASSCSLTLKPSLSMKTPSRLKRSLSPPLRPHHIVSDINALSLSSALPTQGLIMAPVLLCSLSRVFPSEVSSFLECLLSFPAPGPLMLPCFF